MIQEYPKTYNENLAWRRGVLIRAKEDAKYRRKTKELFFRDVLFAFNTFFYTLDVRKRPFHHQPFCTYDYQDVVILQIKAHIERGQDLALEKSRDMGVSWMVILVYLWFWLDPKGGADFLLGSRIEDYVDKKGDMRTLFEKARYTYYRLPSWLRPKGFRQKVHDNYMRLQNPESGASITGESNNANWSTGGRYLSTFCDEFAKWEGTDTAAWTAAGDATPCRIAVSTPFGAAGEYYNLVTDGKTRKLTLHWSLHPKKAVGLYCVFPKPEDAADVVNSDTWTGLRSPWYDSECIRRRPEEIAQELDIDYIGAGSPVFKGVMGKRLAQLLRYTRDPLMFFKVEFGQLSLTGVTNINSVEDYIRIYEEPSKDHSYVVSCDVAEGKDSGDFGIIKVLNRETESIAASYSSQVDEIQLARVLVAITKHYTLKGCEAPWWAVEANGPGLATFDLATELYDLPNAFMMPTYDVVKQSPSFRKGWWTSTNSKRALVSGIKKWLLDATGWCDTRCAKEMTTFVRSKTGKPQAKEGTNDDEVMALGIALQVNELAPYEEKRIVKLPGIVEQAFGAVENIVSSMEESRLDEPVKTYVDYCLETAIASQNIAKSEWNEFMEQ